MKKSRINLEVRTAEGKVECIPNTIDNSLHVEQTGVEIVTIDSVFVSIVVVGFSNWSELKRCLQSILKTTSDLKYIVEIIVVANGCDEFMLNCLKQEKDLYHELLVVEEYHNWLSAVDVGFSHAIDVGADYIALIDEKVEVFDGWLESMIDSFIVKSGISVGLVVPWSSKQISPVSGFSYEDMAERFQISSTRTRPQWSSIGSFMFIVRANVFERVGGFSREEFNPGFGAVFDLQMRIKQIGFDAVLADDVLVLDRTDGNVIPDIGKAGSMVLRKIWGDTAIENQVSKGLPNPTKFVERALSIADRKLNRVVFVFQEVVVCGAVLLVTHVCNELIRLGWDATIACTHLEPSHRNKLPMNFEPLVYISKSDMINRLSKELPKNSIVVAPLFHAFEIVVGITENRPDLIPINYVQDDETKFKTKGGEYQVVSDIVYGSFSKFENILANSEWVAKVVENIICRDIPVICPGVDVDMFRPRDSWRGVARVIAHCRPSTPRRGWEFIAAVVRRAAQSKQFEFITYDEQPNEMITEFHVHVGRLSPEQLSKVMGNSDIFIEGSDIQGFGMQALEAMSCGLALICTNNKGIDSFGTTEQDCMIVEHGDVEKTAAILCKLIDDSTDRKKLGSNARETAKNFNWDIIAKCWDEYLKVVIS